MGVSMLEISFRRVRTRLVAGVITSGVHMTSRRSRARRRKVLLTQAPRTSGSCQVRSKTQSPCSRRAEVEILGIPFCEACAREQEAYFAIGELTQEEQKRNLRIEPLIRKSLAETLGEMLSGMRSQRTDELAAARRLDLPRVDEPDVWRLRKARQRRVIAG